MNDKDESIELIDDEVMVVTDVDGHSFRAAVMASKDFQRGEMTRISYSDIAAYDRVGLCIGTILTRKIWRESRPDGSLLRCSEIRRWAL